MSVRVKSPDKFVEIIDDVKMVKMKTKRTK